MRSPVRLVVVGGVLAGLGIGVAGASGAFADDPSAYGCVLGGGEGQSLPTVNASPQIGGDSCTFTAPGAVAFAGLGTFTVTVSHDTGTQDPITGAEIIETTTYNSADYAEPPGSPSPAAVGETNAVAGDTVTASITDDPSDPQSGGLLAVGTDPCPVVFGGACPTAPTG